MKHLGKNPVGMIVMCLFALIMLQYIAQLMWLILLQLKWGLLIGLVLLGSYLIVRALRRYGGSGNDLIRR